MSDPAGAAPDGAALPPTGTGPSEPTAQVEAVLQEALADAEREDWPGMAERLLQALEAEPEDPYLLCWLGLAEREMGLEGLAYERFLQALASEPTDPVLLATAGNALASFDDPGAEAALRTAALLGPNLAQARWMYGAYLAREGMTDAATEELEAAARLDPEDPLIRVELGVARALAGDTDRAAHEFSAAVELDPGDGWALVLLGLAHVQAGEIEESVPSLDEGARARPDDVEAQLLAALALASTGWEEKGLEMLERARLSDSGDDRELVELVDSNLAVPEEALHFLTRTLAPTAFRARLMERP